MNEQDRSVVLGNIETEIPRLRRYARYLVRDIECADDLVQDCLVRAIEHIDQWKPGTNLRAWMFVILKNVFLNELQRSKRETPNEWRHDEEFIVPAAQEARLTLLEIQDAFFKLSDEHREILLLIAIEGLKYEEASLVLEIPVGTIRSRLSRARRALSNLIETGKAHLDAARKEQGGG